MKLPPQVTELSMSGLLRAALEDCWVCEARVGEDGVTVYHVQGLGEALEINARQIAAGWSSGYIVFAVTDSVEQAHHICDVMRHLQDPHADQATVDEDGIPF